MTSHPSPFFPQPYEMVGLGFVAIMLMLLTSSEQLLTYYGLNSSSQLLKDGLGTSISQGLTQLDQFSFTDSVVTFIIWALVGVLCFSIVRVIGGFYQELEFDKELSSNHYIHPSTFRRGAFWSRVGESFVLSVLGIGLLGVVLYGLFGFVIPIAAVYGRTFLLATSLTHIGGLLLGLAVLYVGLLALDLALRFLLFHNRLTNKN